MALRRKIGIAVVLGLAIVVIVLFSGIGQRVSKMWREIGSIGGGDVIATFNDNGLARLRANGEPVWEVTTDYIQDNAHPSVRQFPGGLLAVAGTPEDETGVVDGVDPQTGNRLWRVKTRPLTSLGAVAAFGARKYFVGSTQKGECDLSSFDEDTRAGWSRSVSEPSTGPGATLVALPDSVVVLGNHGGLVLDAKDGARRHAWSALGRMRRVEDRVIWLAWPSYAAQWPGKVRPEDLLDFDSLVLLSWTPGTAEVEVLGHLPRGANLEAVGRYGRHWVATASFAGPSISIFGLPQIGSDFKAWRIDLPVGEMYDPATVLTGWMPLEHPSDGLLTRLVPIHTFDRQRHAHLRWIDIESGKITPEKVFNSDQNLEVRRDGDRLVIMTSDALEVYDANAQLIVSHPIQPTLIHAFRGHRATLSGDGLWFVDGKGRLVRQVLRAIAPVDP